MSSPTPPALRRSLPGAGALDKLFKAALLRKFAGLKKGRLTVVDESGDAPDARVFQGPEDGPRARLTVRRPRFFLRTALGGSVGAGESFAEGDWEADDLAALVRLFVANRGVLDAMDRGLGAALQPAARLLHLLRANTRNGARENIRAHYDLGNDFFALFLDETWMYSCGIFKEEGSTLAEASTEKNDRICRKLGLSPSDHLLEIGTGWGGFALHAAKHYGCRVTTTTISRAQHELARERVREAGLQDRVELLFEDYRDLKGRYDKLVSIEMIEAVGLGNLETYFKACGERLKPEGSMLLQSIVIQDRYYEQARRSVDFIQRYIFPGSGIPSVGSLVAAAARGTDMRLFHQEDLTPHYARTLRCWSERLRDNKDKMLSLGYPETLYRMWQFYFGYCEGGFAERQIGLVQMLFTKPENRRAPLLGAL
jgi:cyclopropane-fatty-acyl-phospholipid synthase